MKMKLRFCESEIDDLATRYTEDQHEENREREEQLIGLRKKILREGTSTNTNYIRSRVGYYVNMGRTQRNPQEGTLTIT